MKKLFHIFKWCLIIALAIGQLACSGSTAKGISGILKDKKCHGGCSKKMPCEGKIYEVEMQLTGNNVLTSGRVIFARDPDNYEHTLRIEFDEMVPIEVYANIKDSANKRFVVRGLIEGYDQYSQEKCYRSWIIYVKDKNDFKVFTN